MCVYFSLFFLFYYDTQVGSSSQRASGSGSDTYENNLRQDRVEREVALLKTSVSEILDKLRSYEGVPTVLEKVKDMLSARDMPNSVEDRSSDRLKRTSDKSRNQSGTVSVIEGIARGAVVEKTLLPHSTDVSDVPPIMDSEAVNTVHAAKGKTLTDDEIMYETNCVPEINNAEMHDSPRAGATEQKHSEFQSESPALTTKDVNHELQSTNKGKCILTP